MGKTNGKNTKQQSEGGKVITKYDRKIQRRKEEAMKEAVRKRAAKIIGIVLAAAVVLGIASGVWINYDKIHREYIAVDGDSISGIEFDFYYGLSKHAMLNQSLYGVMTYEQYFQSYMGYDSSKSDTKQEYSSATGQTWYDYFAGLALSAIKEDKALLKLAEERGFEYTKEDEDYQQFSDEVASAAEEEGIAVKEYYKKYFGSHATEKNLKKYIAEYHKAIAYQDQLREELAASESDIQAYYEEHKEDYDTIDYRVLEIAAEDADSMEQAKNKAEEFRSKIQTEGDFIAYCKDYASEDDKEKYETDDDASKVTGASKSAMNTDAADWMFDENRKAGDVTVIEDTTNSKYSVYYFVSRNYSESTNDTIAETILSERYSELITPYIENMAVKNPFNRLNLQED